MVPITGLVAGLGRRAVGLLGRLATPQGYVICSTPRSGSNYLCQLLASTGVMGVPREYFNTEGRRQREDPAYPADPREQLKKIRSVGATRNGVFGVKIHSSQMTALAGTVDPFAELPHVRVLLLRRRDLLGQSLSWARALQTSQWRAGDTPSKLAEYDRSTILSAHEFISAEAAFWDGYLKARRIEPLEIVYEELCRRPQHQIDRVRRFLRLREPCRTDPSKVDVAIQRDELTEAWRARFVAETAGASVGA